MRVHGARDQWAASSKIAPRSLLARNHGLPVPVKLKKPIESIKRNQSLICKTSRKCGPAPSIAAKFIKSSAPLKSEKKCSEHKIMKAPAVSGGANYHYRYEWSTRLPAAWCVYQILCRVSRVARAVHHCSKGVNEKLLCIEQHLRQKHRQHIKIAQLVASYVRQPSGMASTSRGEPILAQKSCHRACEIAEGPASRRRRINVGHRHLAVARQHRKRSNMREAYRHEASEARAAARAGISAAYHHLFSHS